MHMYMYSSHYASPIGTGTMARHIHIHVHSDTPMFFPKKFHHVIEEVWPVALKWIINVALLLQKDITLVY